MYTQSVLEINKSNQQKIITENILNYATNKGTVEILCKSNLET